MKHCGKHDITFPDGGTCWNCDEQKMSPEEKQAAYENPEFLTQRGGAGSQSAVMSGLSQNQMKKLRELLGKDALGGAPSRDLVSRDYSLPARDGLTAKTGKREVIAQG